MRQKGQDAAGLVSIIMPAYNASKYIKESIESVLEQTYSAWELIVINDGSKDNTREVVLSFSDPRVKLIDQENKGVSAARNRGMAEMEGDYFCFLDADDVFTSNSLASRLAVFAENPELSFVDGKVEVKDHKLQQIVRTYVPQFKGVPFGDLISLSGKSFFGPTWLIKRKQDVDYKLKEKMTHAEDLLFYISISRDGLYDYTTDCILYYRSGHSSAMSNIEGLERGYITLYTTLKEQFDLNLVDLGYLKYKIMRIVFLSYLSKGAYASASQSIFRILSM